MRFFLLALSLLVTLLLGASFSPTSAFAGVEINLSGSNATSSNNLEKSTTHAVSGNIGLGLGDFVSIGLTHRRSYINNTGFKKGRSADGTAYVYNPFTERTESITSSIDLTLIPFSGTVSPFIFGGVARRDYYNQFDYQGSRITSTQTLYPVPNYGGGVAIQLGGSFQLKITQTFSPGKQTSVNDGVESEKEVRDSYTELWLGYKL